MPTVESYQKDPIHEDIRMFEMELKKKFPDLVVTSGYRPNAKTAQGHPSRHSKGEAIDLRYNPEIRDYLWNTKEGVGLLNKYQLGFLDESDPETLKRTKGSAPHFHIGRDSTLVPKTKQRYQELWGQDYAEQLQPNINSEPTNFEENNTFSTFETQPVAHTKIGAGLPIINDEKETPKKQKNTSKEKEALLQKQKEHQFIQDYLNGSIQKQVVQRRQQPQQQTPQLDPLQEYNQISSFVENPIMQDGGQIPTTRNGVFDTNGEPVIVPSPNIDMKNVDYPIMGISQETGEKKLMMPDMQYFFNDTKNVLEIPMMQQGGKIDRLEYKLPEEDNILDYMINDFSKEKGGNRELYTDLMDSIAYHESAGTMNHKMKQYGNGPGRGKYMFEGEDGSNRLLTSAKRLKNYFKIKEKPLPNFVSEVIEGKIKDATKLSAKQQDILFLGDIRMGKVDLKDYVKGNITKQDLWADHWWQGSSKDKDKRIAQFNNSLKSYNQENS